MTRAYGRVATAATVIALALAAAAACDAFGSNEDDNGSPDASTADALAPSLNCPSACLAPAPPGWTGPSAVFRGLLEGGLPPCPDAYPKYELDAHEGLDAGSAVCSCGPGTRSVHCKVVVHQADDSLCSTNVQTSNFTFGSSTVCFAPSMAYYSVPPPTIASASCTFDASAVVPPLTFEAQSISCGMLGDVVCPGRPDCRNAPVAPSAPFDRFCIHRDGEVDCPSADYAQRFVAYSDKADTRACTPCSGDAGAACGTDFVQGSTCDAGGTTDPADGTCLASGAAQSVLALSTLGPQPRPCSAFQESAPVGEAHSSSPVTFCCNR